ncbi:MAG: NAD-dependent malic enzyme [Verrucomicrobia bacterium]|nr:NAD-dependent malic enzyme [Verrucomicrobiota bacterium]
MEFIELSMKPAEILDNPLFNKGTAFTKEERDSLHLHGLLPFHVSTLEEQVQRRYENFKERRDDLSKYIFLSSLQNRNEILFYRLVYEHIAEMLPLIYTPTVGDVSLHYSILYRQHRGIYISYPLQDKIGEIVATLPNEEVDVIVVTDGERILGLGDVGVGGMAIPQGKLALYTLFGGIHPGRVLPVMLDVGTNNQKLLDDPLYLGWRNPRITGSEYDSFVDAFVRQIKKRFPKVLLQWEDFAKPHARPLLEKYKDQICSFNDDIQGTAAVALAAIIGAVKQAKGKLKDQKIVMFGGGSAGLGIASLIMDAMRLEGCSESEAQKNFYIIDIDGLIHTKLSRMDAEQKRFARDFNELKNWQAASGDKYTLLDVVKNVKPTILIGVSAQPNVFSEEVVKTMASHVERPIIFPLSNPTSRCEAKPEDLIRWTNGKAIIATGSPFAPVEFNGKKIRIAQCNNVYIFPGVGLGVVACQSPKVTEKMFIRAADVLSDNAPLLKDPTASIFPDVENLRDVSRKIAIAVAKVAAEEGLVPHSSQSEIERKVDEKMWFPEYPNFRRKNR